MASNPRKVTIRDIARAAGVSPSTVSRTFDPAEKHRISEKTRKRIERVAEKHRYLPNRIARALSRGGSETIALVLPDSLHFSESEFYARVVMHAGAALSESHFDLKLHMLRPGETHESFAGLLQSLAVDGLLIAGVPTSERFAVSGIGTDNPVVMLNSYAEPSVSSVNVDNVHGGDLAAAHFIANGHTALGMLTGPKVSRDAIDRATGFRKRMITEGLNVNEKWFVPCEYGVQEGFEAARRLLRRARRPTAVFCANDEIALGALRAVKGCGLDCPDDISLIGFDNFSAVRHTSPPIASIEHPIAEMADAAVDLLLKLIAGSVSVMQITFPVTLLERESVCCRS